VIKKKYIIALIPAKKNSIRLNGKNLKKIGYSKKRLVWFSIKAALKAKHISKVIVSTDCKKIKNYAEKNGAEVPFLRPKNLCLKNTKMLDVIMHAYKKINTEDNKIDAMVILQPTSPLRESSDIDQAINLFYKKRADYVASFSKAKPVNWYYQLNKSKSFQIKKKYKNKNTYNNFLINGSIYVYNSKILKKKVKIRKSFGFEMPYTKSFDIDTLEEFKVTEAMLNYKRNN
tara:strand:+ start:5575 stop:6264 length:690 start_codon:yes stop_codon:yes gene_type:complete